MIQKCRSYWMVDALGRKCYKVPRKLSSVRVKIVLAAIVLLSLGFGLGFTVGRLHSGSTQIVVEQGANA